jgi:hypothetical protein
MATYTEMPEGVRPFEFDSHTGKVTVRGLSYFPREIFDIADEVKILDMSTVHLATLPEDLARLRNLKVAFFSYNKELKEFPEVLASCLKLETIGMRACNISKIAEGALPPNLRALILTDNHISTLPRSIGNCSKLQKLMMAGNELESLPKELLECKNLEIVRFSANSLALPPDWLLELPRLAWYGDSSNPFSLQPDSLQATTVNWDDIRLGPELGRSANNLVHRGTLPDGREVAVKLYGHALVTDGLPVDDMNACLQAGIHPNIIGGIGKVIGAPDDSQALVMPLIPDEFKNLGKPPSLATVCRDTYPPGQIFSVSYVREVIRTVALDMRYLHQQGVMHGDLYAHNILTNEKGESYVGDFGAASLYRPGSAVGLLRERVDVRAFGILIRELLARCTALSAENTNVADMNQLASNCLDIDSRQRPTFADIIENYFSERVLP